MARLLSEPSATRARLTAECFVPRDEHGPVGAIELALTATLAAEPTETKLRTAERGGRLQQNRAPIGAKSPPGL